MTFELGEPHYRRSEQPWPDAGEPRARVRLSTRHHALAVSIRRDTAERRFVPIDAVNPLDNEPAAINGDGVQLYVTTGDRGGAWLAVPDPSSDEITSRRVDGWPADLHLSGRWRPAGDGYEMDLAVELPAGAASVDVDVIVNEIGQGRERRRGQLILSGAHGEFVYLRGDRHDRDRLLRFALRND